MPYDLSMFDAYQAQKILELMAAMPYERAVEITTGLFSPFYPYKRVQENYQTLSGAELLPQKLVEYLLDLRRPDIYTPCEDNTFPRARFWRYLFWDSKTPLLERYPTDEEKRKLLFDAQSPTDPPDSERGYRLYSQAAVNLSQSPKQTVVRVVTGRKMPSDAFTTSIALEFDIIVSSENERLNQGIARSEGIEQAIIESLSGVHIGGCGCVLFSRDAHPDCGTHYLIDRNGANIGRRLTMAVEWKAGLSNFDYGAGVIL